MSSIGHLIVRVGTAMAVMLLMSGPAAGQTSEGSGVFVEGGIFAGFERFSFTTINTNGPRPMPNASPSGTALGGLIGGGAFLRPFLSARIELALPTLLEATAEERVGRLSASDTVSVRLQDVYVVLAFHTGSQGRVRVDYLGGAALRRQKTNSQGGIMGIGVSPRPPVIVDDFKVSSVYYSTGVAVGLDVEVPLSDYVAVIPQLRAVGTAGVLSVRTGVSVRWNP